MPRAHVEHVKRDHVPSEYWLLYKALWPIDCREGREEFEKRNDTNELRPGLSVVDDLGLDDLGLVTFEQELEHLAGIELFDTEDLPTATLTLGFYMERIQEGE